jgi:hypothetical protein
MYSCAAQALTPLSAPACLQVLAVVGGWRVQLKALTSAALLPHACRSPQVCFQCLRLTGGW